jgi:GntR family transcriptional repressor for pyruvate dehydrogenase complex
MQKASRNLPQQVSEDILNYILNNHLKPGDKLPNETIFAENLKVGRSSIREAMKLLVSRNVIEIRQGSGTYVSGRLGVSDDPLGLVFLEDSPKLLRDLMEIRMLLEPAMAVEAAIHSDREDVAQIAHYCSETERLIREGQPHAQADVQFHQAIAYASKNTVAPRLMSVICRTVDTTGSSDLQEIISSHREITRAILEHDEVVAKDAMYLHLVYRHRILAQTFSSQTAAMAEEELQKTNRN